MLLLVGVKGFFAGCIKLLLQLASGDFVNGDSVQVILEIFRIVPKVLITIDTLCFILTQSFYLQFLVFSDFL